MTDKTQTTVRLLYFSWVREKVGRADETVALPPHVATISDLMAWLTTKGPEYQAAFAPSNVIRAAIDQVHAKIDSDIKSANEIAFFPPVTGG